MVAKPKLRYVSRKYIIAKAFGYCNQKIPEVYELKRMNGRNRKGGSMARGDSVTVSFRLNLNREEDMEIWSFLTGDAIEPCFGDKSKFIKSALIRVVQGIKQDESEKRLVCELNAQREAIQNVMSGEADRIINAVKLIVEEQVKIISKFLKSLSRYWMMILRIMRCRFCQIFSRQVKRSYTPGNTEDKKGNTECDTDYFMVILVVIQVEAGIT